MADVLSTVSRVLPFRNATIRAMRSSLSDASHVAPWACSALAIMSSFFATMVRASSVTFSTCSLTVSHRVRAVCEPPRRPQSHQGHHRVGGHSRARRMAPTVYPHLRPAFHRGATCRNWASVPDYTWSRPPMHLGRTWSSNASSRPWTQRNLGGSAIAGGTRARRHAR
jgi:hypothetical protein